MNHETYSKAIDATAAELPGKIAFRTPTEVWSYGDLKFLSDRLASGLQMLGLSVGDRIGCLTRHMAECAVLVLGAQKIGAVCVPINWRLTPSEVEYIINHSEASFIMADVGLLPLLADIRIDNVRERIATRPADGFQDLRSWAAQQQGMAPDDTADIDAAALQLYSSGTTGRPKGVVLSHRNLINLCTPTGAGLDYSNPNSVTLNVLPTFHIGGLGLALMALFGASETVTAPEFVPKDVLSVIATHQVTHAFLVPAMIHAVLQVCDAAVHDFSSLRMLAYGASPVSDAVLVGALQLFKCEFTQHYGLPETMGTVVRLLPEDHDPTGPRAFLLRSAGISCPGTSIRIVDTASARDLVDGEVGEIWIHSPQNMLEYWRDERATNDAFPEGKTNGQGWFRTGDAGYTRNGYLFIEDRIKDMIISGGETIYPVEVENVLMAHPDVLDCAVFAIPDEKWGESVKACIVRKPGIVEIDAQDLIDFCRGRLAHYKCPRSFDFADTLPRTPSGKLQKHVRREPYWRGRARKVS